MGHFLDEPQKKTYKGRFLDEEPSIYSKGGIYEQFGPTPPPFDISPREFGGFVQAGADQPGASLPFVGQASGGYAGPIGGVVGALAGEGLRQGLGRKFGTQKGADSGRQFRKAGEAAIKGEAFGVGLNALTPRIASGLESLKPSAISKAIRIARNIIRPTGKLAKRGGKIAETALEEGVLSSNKGKMMEKINKKLEGFDQELEDLIDRNQGKQMTGERGISRMRALERWYRSKGASDKADKVRSVMEDIIRGENLQEPVYGEVEKGAFKLGGGEITSPKKVILEKDKFGPLGERLKSERTPKIIQETKYQGKTRGLQGESRKIREIVGKKPREFSVKTGQAKKIGQYELLKKSKSGGGYGSETSTPEIETRQEFAGGIRRGLEKNIPEVGPLNRRFGNMIELGKAAKGRESVSSRNNFLDLGDLGIVAASTLNPKALAILIARKISQSGQGAIAKKLYDFGKSGVTKIPKINPAVRALISSQLRED